MHNRISWCAYNKIRKTEGLATTPKRKRQEDEDTPTAKRRNGCKPENMTINTEELVQEASTWSPTETIIWSQLGTKYGLITPNRGQVRKEFLQEHNIPAASVAQRATWAPRKTKKKFKSGKTSFPMYKPICFERKKKQDKIRRGEIQLGNEVVVSTHSCYKMNLENSTIVEETDKVGARRIPMLEIRKKLLQKHEALGVIRNQPDSYFDNLQAEEVRSRAI